jgi:hypothetical protein
MPAASPSSRPAGSLRLPPRSCDSYGHTHFDCNTRFRRAGSGNGRAGVWQAEANLKACTACCHVSLRSWLHPSRLFSHFVLCSATCGAAWWKSGEVLKMSFGIGPLRVSLRVAPCACCYYSASGYNWICGGRGEFENKGVNRGSAAHLQMPQHGRFLSFSQHHSCATPLCNRKHAGRSGRRWARRWRPAADGQLPPLLPGVEREPLCMHRHLLHSHGSPCTSCGPVSGYPHEVLACHHPACRGRPRSQHAHVEPEPVNVLCDAGRPGCPRVYAS